MQLLFFYICSMMKKRCFGILTSVLALLVIVQQHTIVSNPEIVLEFVNIEINSPEAQNAITIIEQQLHAIGAKNTKVSKGFKKGKLKITYYGDTDIAYIKKALSHEKDASIAFLLQDQGENNLPKKEELQDFKLNIYEVQKASDFSSDFIVNTTLKLKKSQDKQTKFDSYSSTFASSNNDICKLVIKRTQKITAYNEIPATRISYQIPEVRAGPFS